MNCARARTGRVNGEYCIDLAEDIDMCHNVLTLWQLNLRQMMT